MKSTTLDNAQRSNRLEVAMLALGEEYDDEPCTILIDILTDARHWCDHNAQSFAELDRLAYQHYLAEIHEQQRSHDHE